MRLKICAMAAIVASSIFVGTGHESPALADGGLKFKVVNTFEGNDAGRVTDVRAAELSSDGKTVVNIVGPDASGCSGGVCSYDFEMNLQSGTQVKVFSVDLDNGRSGTASVAVPGPDPGPGTVTVTMTTIEDGSKVTGSVRSSDGATKLASAGVVVKGESGVVEFVTQTVGAPTGAFGLGDFLAWATNKTKGTVTASPPQGGGQYGSQRTWPINTSSLLLDGRNLFGKVLGPGSSLETPGSAEAVESLRVHSVQGNGTKTLVASSVDGEIVGDVKRVELTGDDAELGVGVFGTQVDFGSDASTTFELTVVPVGSSSGGTTVFRLPGAIGSKASPMAFRLEPKQGPGLTFKSRQWACRDASDVNCVVSLEARPKGSSDAWSPATLARRSYSADIGSLGSGGEYWGWDKYETFQIPAMGGVAAQDAYVQFFLRPMNDAAPDPVNDPYPYVIIELYEQSNGGELRDGWGCSSSGENWTGAGSGSACRGSAIVSEELEYRVTLRTAGSSFQPIFIAGYLGDMKAALTGTAGTQFEMTVSGAPRPWQWLGGDLRESPTPYWDSYDATNLDWSFSAFDGREVASMGSDGITSCIGLGVATSSTNGNGASMPEWNEDTSTFLFNTQGKHYAPSGITNATNPDTGTAYATGDEYVGEAEITIPVALGQCMWQQSGVQLANLDGQVLDSNGNSKAGATVNLGVTDGYLTVTASGFTYSTADLVVKPKAASGGGAGGSGSSGGSGGSSSEEPASSGADSTSQRPPAASPTAPTVPTTPPAQGALNPPTAQPIAPGIILPSQAEAAALQPTVTRDPPATVFSSAPVIRTTAGQPIAVTAPGLPPGTAFTVRIRQAGGTYATLASVTTDARGNAVLPAFQASRPGTYRIALVDAATGQVRYIKFVVKARR